MINVRQALKAYRHNRYDISDLERLDIAIDNINAHMGDEPLPSVDVYNCRSYREARKTSKVKRYGELHETADSTVARELGVLKAASNDAVKWKLITPDQMPVFEIPKNLPKRVVWLLGDELRRLYIAAQDDELLYMFMRLLYITASRRAAIESLEWSQVDLHNRVIHLAKPDEKKTKKHRPTVPINGEMYAALRDFYTNGEYKYVLERNQERYRSFIVLCEKANLLELPERDGRPAGRMSPHVIRHTRATHLLENGMSPYNVGKLLGDSAATVERVYGHACMSKLSDEIERYS